MVCFHFWWMCSVFSSGECVLFSLLVNDVLFFTSGEWCPIFHFWWMCPVFTSGECVLFSLLVNDVLLSLLVKDALFSLFKIDILFSPLVSEILFSLLFSLVVNTVLFAILKIINKSHLLFLLMIRINVPLILITLKHKRNGTSHFFLWTLLQGMSWHDFFSSKSHHLELK